MTRSRKVAAKALSYLRSARNILIDIPHPKPKKGQRDDLQLLKNIIENGLDIFTRILEAEDSIDNILD
jgi:hypothetical protein